MIKKIVLITAIVILISACAEIQDSSNKVLTNAGSVVRSGQDKLWVKDQEEEQKKSEGTAKQ